MHFRFPGQEGLFRSFPAASTNMAYYVRYDAIVVSCCCCRCCCFVLYYGRHVRGNDRRPGPPHASTLRIPRAASASAFIVDPLQRGERQLDDDPLAEREL